MPRSALTATRSPSPSTSRGGRSPLVPRGHKAAYWARSVQGGPNACIEVRHEGEDVVVRGCVFGSAARPAVEELRPGQDPCGGLGIREPRGNPVVLEPAGASGPQPDRYRVLREPAPLLEVQRGRPRQRWASCSASSTW